MRLDISIGLHSHPFRPGRRKHPCGPPLPSGRDCKIDLNRGRTSAPRTAEVAWEAFRQRPLTDAQRSDMHTNAPYRCRYSQPSQLSLNRANQKIERRMDIRLFLTSRKATNVARSSTFRPPAGSKSHKSRNRLRSLPTRRPCFRIWPFRNLPMPRRGSGRTHS
jgi:hypothetical protein